VASISWGATVTPKDLEERLARLEERYESTAAQVVVSEIMLMSLVRHLPQAADIVADFELHQEYLQAQGLNSPGATDSWLAKLQAAREVLLWRLGTDTRPLE